MKNLDVIGKYLFALPFAVFGLMHFMAANDMAGMVPAAVPGGVIWVYLTGACLVAAAVAILVGKMAKLAATLLGVLLLVFVLSIHLPAVMGGDQMAMSGVLKDLALAGAAFYYASKQAA
jgi:putative oxidoreductase